MPVLVLPNLMLSGPLPLEATVVTVRQRATILSLASRWCGRVRLRSDCGESRNPREVSRSSLAHRAVVPCKSGVDRVIDIDGLGYLSIWNHFSALEH